MSTRRFTGDDIAAAFGQAAPSSECGQCGHLRRWHKREILKPGGGPGSEAFHGCEKWDRRRKSGFCPCEKFTEPDPTNPAPIDPKQTS